MDWEWDTREKGALEVAYRAHLRAMTTARQDAERRRSLLRTRDPEVRRAADASLREALAQINDEHRAWLRERGLAAGPQGR
jgi:hypothetical protein